MGNFPLHSNVSESFTKVSFQNDEVAHADITTASHHSFEDIGPFPDLSEWSRYKFGDGEDLYADTVLEKHGHSATVNVTLASSNAGFRNTLGSYTVDEKGIIRSAQILELNTRSATENQSYTFQTDTNGAQKLEFFIIANGYARNAALRDEDVSTGQLKFVHDFEGVGERLANISDDPKTITVVYEADGKKIALNGPVYHTNNHDLNADGKPHALKGLRTEGDTEVMRIGFEDFPNLGDADFNDVVVDLEIAYNNSNSALFTKKTDGITSSKPDSEFGTELIQNQGDNFENNIFVDLNNGTNAVTPGLVGTQSGETDQGIELASIISNTSDLDVAISNFVEQTQAQHDTYNPITQLLETVLPTQSLSIDTASLVDQPISADVV